jgi:hypothetical protein
VAYAAGRAVDVQSDAASTSKDSEKGGTMKRRLILAAVMAASLSAVGQNGFNT